MTAYLYFQYTKSRISFFIQSTLQFLLEQNGKSELLATDLIRDTSDKRAGSWIFQNAMATNNAKEFKEN